MEFVVYFNRLLHHFHLFARYCCCSSKQGLPGQTEVQDCEMMKLFTRTATDLIEMKQEEMMSSSASLTSCWFDEDSNA